MINRWLETGVAALTAVFFAWALAQSMGFAGQSRVVPVAATGTGTILALLWVLQSVYSQMAPRRQKQSAMPEIGGEIDAPPEPEPGPATRRVSMTMALIVGYALGIDAIGFFPTTAVFVVLVSFVLGLRKPAHLVAGTTIFTGFLWLIFKMLLNVPLPSGALWQWI